MKRPLRLPPRAICWLALLWLAAPSHAQVLQDLTANLYSTNYGRGVNFSAQRASDVPANKVLLNGLAATPIQFRGEITYGAVVRPRANATLTPGQNYSQNSVQLDLPRVEVNGTVTLVLRSATVGVAAEEVTLPAAFVMITSYCVPESAVPTGFNSKVAPRAPRIFTPLRRH